MARPVKGVRVKPSLKAFNCKNCGSPVEIKVTGQTLNVVCPSCKSIIDAKDPNFRILQKYESKKKFKSYIPLGSRGKLKGKLWECTGFVVKSDSGYFWAEYLLYNPYHGYRWLAEVNGHWVLYKRVHHVIGVKRGSTASYKGKKFKLYNHGVAKVEYVEGEFYWRIKREDRVTVSDYISPPEGLSVEYSKWEENWSLGYHIDAEVIKKSFKISKEPPYQEGVGMIQPSPVKEALKNNSKVMVQALALLFIIHAVRTVTASNKQVFYDQIEYKSSRLDPNALTVTPDFEVTGNDTNLKIIAEAPVYNSWVYLDALLFDSQTRKGIPMPLEISYYRGSDWSEGGESKSRVVNNVPPGKYYLSLKFQSGPQEYKGYVKLWLKRDVTVNSNFFISVFLILLGPLFGFLRSRSFEVKRWSNSDYSPYQHEE